MESAQCLGCGKFSIDCYYDNGERDQERRSMTMGLRERTGR